MRVTRMILEPAALQANAYGKSVQLFQIAIRDHVTPQAGETPAQQRMVIAQFIDINSHERLIFLGSNREHLLQIMSGENAESNQGFGPGDACD
jgi:hypothetical protein